MTIFAEITGQGDDVVLIHGGCDKHQYLQPIADFLSHQYRVTNIDTPGRGLSPWQPQIKNIHDLADALLPVLPAQATYIGWSFGGLITLSLAARYPDRVKRAITIGSSPKFIEDDNWIGVPKPGFSALIAGLDEEGIGQFLRCGHDDEFAAFDPKPASYTHLNSLIDKKENIDLMAVKQRIQICDATDLRFEFQNLECPIDLILGGKDGAVPLAAHEQIRKLNPKAQLHVIPDAKHMMFWTHPEAFNAILADIMSL